MKPPIGSFPDPTSPLDAANRDYVDNALTSINVSRGDYIHVKLTSNQIAPLSTNDTVNFDTTMNSRGDLSLDASVNVGRFAVLKAGRTYLLQAQLWIQDTALGRVEWQWHNITGNSRIGGSGIVQIPASVYTSSDAALATAIITPTVDTEVDVRLNLALNNVALIRGSGTGLTSATIIEIGANTISASGDYIGASLTTPISAVIVVNDPVVFDQVDYQRGLLSLDDVAGKVDGLKAGRTYELMATLSGDTNAGQLWDGWYDSDTNGTLGTAGVSLSVDSAVSAAPNPVARAIYTPSVDTSVEVRVVFASPTSIDISQFSVIQVKELGARAVEHGNRFGPGHLDGLAMVYNTVSTVDIAVGTARDSTDVIDITVESLLTANIAVSGVANGLDTGTSAVNTWYALYVVDGPTVPPASLLSASFTAPTLPAGYTVFRRVGAVLNDGTAAFFKFHLRLNGRSREVWWDSFNIGRAAALSAGGSDSYVAVDCSGYAPPTATALAFQYFYTNNSSNTRYFLLRVTGGSSENFMFRPGNISATPRAGRTSLLPCDSNQSIDYRVSAVSAANVLDLWVMAYVDEL